ncbi:protein phosphatase [Strigomonas culicis]|uniref:Protein phosphatase n=1 Tax=Strigomonas culicis TaxID=28005 RepID=S9TW75_9TRYP|nr:protein phosphatase [Strigomonas culicis]EPY33496.1 protein phosphatase [Strigomonas culicis]|eukprot:EPY22722.1 protein phosphatase [Strigomonas culicis]
MGSVLPKPILSKVVDRTGNGSVSAACASVNGYRSSMEDAHMLVAENGAKYSYFGIFDGHNNEKCSEYIAEHMPARLKALKEPITAAALERVCTDLDEAFFKQDNDGGSTGTFCLIGADYKVKIANVGDSRILVSRKGKMVFHTEDHKPYNPGEAERIVRCGGSVTNNRVDGDLAVSRAFGDSMFKVAGTKDYRNQKVIAVPDVSEVACQAGDTIILACDGVFEGDFSNAEVCAFVQEQMTKCWGDLAVVACRVCDQAILRGSKDNISCMIVQLEDGSSNVKTFGASSFVPGPPFPRNHEGCRTAYIKMAELGHVTAADALQRRYQLLQRHVKGQLNTEPPVMRTAFEMSDEVDVDTETTFFGRGPSPGNEKAFFTALAQGNN